MKSASCADDAPFSFTSENLKKVDEILARYPEGWKASAVMPLLTLAQAQNGNWLSKNAIATVSALLDMPQISVYEVASFYTMYALEPRGKHHVELCTNLPCWLRGSDALKTTCESVLGIKMGQTREDGSVTLSEVECMGACAGAPMAAINGDYCENLDPEQLKALLAPLITPSMN
jgi:NADH-quinone oxidoreductase E subunit